MLRRVIESLLVCLVAGMASIFGSGLASSHAQAASSRFAEVPRLFFSTYLGGSTPCDTSVQPCTFAQYAVSDAWGNTYVTGATRVSDLPVKNAFQAQPFPESTMSAFIMKYDPVGQVIWGTYLGGNHESLGKGVAVMPDGGVAVAGLTRSDGSGSFPTLRAYQDKHQGESDYFVAVFDANGNLRYSTYLGGSGVEGDRDAPFSDNSQTGNNVAVDSHGVVYVTGITASGGDGEGGFPVTSKALQPEFGGTTDAFLSVIDPSKSGDASLLYSSFLGGAKEEKGHSIAVDASGRNITLAGYTRSRDFPTTANAYRSTPPPEGFTSNAFVARFTPCKPGAASSAYRMPYSTYFGANSTEARDEIYCIALDAKGRIAATGRTQSPGFPMVDHPSPSIYNAAPYLEPDKSGDEPFLVKIDPSLNGKASLVYSTYLGGGHPASGGTGGSFGTSVAADGKGAVFVGGETSAAGVLYAPSSRPVEAPSLLPYTENALYPANQGKYDAILMQVAPRGDVLGYSTFLGGTDDDHCYGIAVDPAGNVVLSGVTTSSDFPLAYPAQIWPGNNGSQNAFVARFSSLPVLSVTRPCEGAGTVTSIPQGIKCGSICRAGFRTGTRVALIPTPESGSVFAGWSGACTGSGKCIVTMGADKSVGANFIKGSCIYVLSPERMTFSWKGGQALLWVTARGCSYCPAPEIINDTDWIAANVGVFVDNRGWIRLSIQKNGGTAPRYGAVTVGGSTFAVTQKGKP